MASSEQPDLKKYRERMERAVVALKEEFATLRTGRASAALLDQVHVEAYGSQMPISQVGSVSVPEPLWGALAGGGWQPALSVTSTVVVKAC